MLKAGVGVHGLLVAVLELVQGLGIPLPEEVDAVAEALKAAHSLAADHIRRQHPLHAALVAQQQGHAVWVRQAQVADGILLHSDRLDVPEGIQQPGQVDAEDLAHTAGTGIAHKEVFVVFPGVPIRQILTDVVDIMHRLAESLHLLFDVLRFAAVQHGGGEEQRQVFGGRLGHVLGIAVPYQVQLGKNRQVVIQQFADDRSMGERRGANQSGVRVLGGHGLGNGGIGGVRQAQGAGLGTAGLGGIHAHNVEGGVNAFGQARAALAHTAQTNDEKFHTKTLLWGSNSGTGPS